MSEHPRRLRVLMVSGDMPSHPIAIAKLAICLSQSGHEVTIAVPAGKAVQIAEDGVRNTPIRVVVAGHTTTKVQLNVHGSADASSWRHMLQCLRNPIPDVIAGAADMTAPMFDPLVELMRAEPRPDVVVLGHYMACTGGDAAEVAGLPAVTFVHVPYDPAVFLGEGLAWRYPRMLPSLPHVSAYPTVPPPGWRGWRQLAWKWVDSALSAAAWARSARVFNALRASRGLPPTATGGWAGYVANHPAVALGGPPFGPPAPVPPLTVVVGAVEPEGCEDLPAELAAWLEGGPAGTVFVSMGTGFTFSDREARQLACGLGRGIAGSPGGPKLLWALRASEQDRLGGILREELGGAAKTLPGVLSFCDGKVRVESFVPQRAVLASGRISLFLSHMGFGACTEGVSAGVPFVAYPGGGFDQEFNATRAEEAGFAIRAPRDFLGIEGVVRKALADAGLSSGALRAQRQLRTAGGGQAAVRAIEHFAALGREGADALALPFGTHGRGESRRLRSAAVLVGLLVAALGTALSLARLPSVASGGPARTMQ